jgi:hypothetical protein
VQYDLQQLIVTTRNLTDVARERCEQNHIVARESTTITVALCADSREAIAESRTLLAKSRV